jgi:hypothetical protein
MEQRMGGGGLFLITSSDGTKKQLSAEEVREMGLQIICNPFLLRLWLQHPDNMTLLPIKFACNFPRQHSWRRMQVMLSIKPIYSSAIRPSLTPSQITPPPTASLSMTIWSVHYSRYTTSILAH